MMVMMTANWQARAHKEITGYGDISSRVKEILRLRAENHPNRLTILNRTFKELRANHMAGLSAPHPPP
jgi:hypothetical protein